MGLLAGWLNGCAFWQRGLAGWLAGWLCLLGLLAGWTYWFCGGLAGLLG
jgi:hypothetical protein